MSKSNRREQADALWDTAVTPKALADDIYGSAMDVFGDVDRDMVVVNTDGSIQIGQFVMQRTGLDVRGDITKNDWLAFGQKLSELKDSIQWILGDWANLGKENAMLWVDDDDKSLQAINPESEDGKYQALLTDTPYAYQTLRNFAYVAGKIPVSRRRDSLSFTHHAEVAPCSAEDQEYFLERAETENLSTRQLREIVNPKIEAPPMELFEDNLKSFRRKQRSLARKVPPHQRMQMAEYLRQLADEIEKIKK